MCTVCTHYSVCGARKELSKAVKNPEGFLHGLVLNKDKHDLVGALYGVLKTRCRHFVMEQAEEECHTPIWCLLG